ncbi:MAG: glucose 1-dehydrogenase [Candidatus Eisenbacteria bacterium]|uniref:Glucose 1-dehydrogenase n=1 Tax=Eiseniibacteriota bacterium TaxID=2212470 RepID=A0A956NHE3_UNCEI|nr:glucose 1-dehydrogenase [Candidatus Eisenbacteria bacterium]MCB9465948.1 glucose 1-dehydrogenase [Candidatus Eisenbacteria bacterium]
MKKMDGKVVIITGAAAGLGRAAAERFAAEGASLSLWDRDEVRGGELAAKLGSEGANVGTDGAKLGAEGAKVQFRSVDVADEASVDEAVAAVVEEFGRIDVLINNAGITRDSTLLKMESAQFDAVIDVNLRGVFHCGRAVGKVMVAQGSGAIVNTSSVVALYGNFGQTNYVASKAGVIGMTKVWARELGRKGVRVNAVAPGFIATEMVEAMPEKVRTAMSEKAPLGRLGQPSEIAAAYLFLASDEASFVNGAVLSVDGGLIS